MGIVLGKYIKHAEDKNTAKYAAMGKRRAELISAGRRQEIARKAATSRWQRFATATTTGRIDYIERKLLGVLEDELTDRDKLIKAALALLAWEKHRLVLQDRELAGQPPVEYTQIGTELAPKEPEIDVTTLTNDELRAMAKGIHPLQPAAKAAELFHKLAQMPLTTRDPEGNDPDR